jgi:uncharacterized integral membrane protein
MQVFFLVALVFGMVAVMFAVQNIVPVTVSFLTWTFEGSLALVLFVALIAGALVSFLASVPALARGRRAVKGLKKQIARLEGELEDCRRRRDVPDAGSVNTPGRAGVAGGGAPTGTPPAW